MAGRRARAARRPFPRLAHAASNSTAFRTELRRHRAPWCRPPRIAKGRGVEISRGLWVAISSSIAPRIAGSFQAAHRHAHAPALPSKRPPEEVTGANSAASVGAKNMNQCAGPIRLSSPRIESGPTGAGGVQ